MPTTEIFIVIVLGILLLIVLARVANRLTLEEKFARLGDITGKSQKEIEASVGKPNSFSAMAEDQILLQWIEDGYHIALVFENGKCKGVSQECSV